MAIAFGADLGFGSSVDASSGTTVTFSTTATVPSGGRVIVGVSFYNAVTVSIGGGGLTWATDYPVQAVGDANRRIALCSADAPSGLASSTTLTATYSGAAYSRCIAGAYFTGIAPSSYTDGGILGEYDGNATWETGTLNTTNANDLLVAACWADFSSGVTSTATAPFTEINDNYGAGPDNSLTMTYRIVSSTGGYIASGTWSADQQWFAVVGAYKAVGTPDAIAPKQGQPVPM